MPLDALAGGAVAGEVGGFPKFAEDFAGAVAAGGADVFDVVRDEEEDCAVGAVVGPGDAADSRIGCFDDAALAREGGLAPELPAVAGGFPPRVTMGLGPIAAARSGKVARLTRPLCSRRRGVARGEKFPRSGGSHNNT